MNDNVDKIDHKIEKRISFILKYARFVSYVTTLLVGTALGLGIANYMISIREYNFIGTLSILMLIFSSLLLVCEITSENIATKLIEEKERADKMEKELMQVEKDCIEDK